LSAIFDRWRPLAIVLGSVVVANVLLHVFVIRRSVQVSGGREAILQSEQERVGKVREELAQLERTASKLACVESDVDTVFERTLSSKGERMTAIQREIRKLARDKRLDPERISYTVSAVRDTGLVRFGISFPLEGPYATLQDFIEEVEASENFLIVQDITLDETQQGPNLKLQIELVTYFQAPDLAVLRAAFPGVGNAT
jgi:Tfp pilus assembly protein PilO